MRPVFLLSYILLSFILISCSESRRSSEQPSNRLASSNSPYLRQHADNPVHWYEWGEEALNRAKKENKLLVISIGYASCHWCHVMERESFMDSTVAAIMNDNFVAIKVDREERPDIDQVYMNAAQLVSGSGGWPLNAFALPDGRPVYAATYFPKDKWIELLNKMAELHRDKESMLLEQAEALTQGISAYEMIDVPADTSLAYTEATYNAIFYRWARHFDEEWGGFRDQQKFPLPVAWEFLLQYHHITGNEAALETAEHTLEAMARGGIYDHVGGGFSRYTVDKEWKIPHFEKMLYDNGQLVSLYANAYKATQKEQYADIVRQSLEFVDRELTDPSGGFYSSVNAESEGEEGKYYVWRQEEIEEVLGEPLAGLVSAYYETKPEGNWEKGKNILYRTTSPEAFAREQGIDEAQWKEMLREGNRKLLQARGKRIRPSVDDKILTSWNALMLMGYIDAYFALGEERYLEKALKNARFLEKNMIRKDGGLWRSYKDGNAGIDAFLDDYALLSRALMQLYQATFDIHWLERSKALADYAIAHFEDETSGMFFYTPKNADAVVRKMELSDNVIPASNSVMAHVLFRLGEFYYEQAYLNRARNMLSHMVKQIPDGLAYYTHWASLMGLVVHQPFEVAIVGENAVSLNRELQAQHLPLAIFMGGREENLPLLENKLSEGETIIYVCRKRVCKMPVKAAEEALKQLQVSERSVQRR